jgi:hypothetical protein
MTGRRQVWTGLAQVLLAFAVPMMVVSTPADGWLAATLIATTLLLAFSATRSAAVSPPVRPGSAFGPAASATAMLFRLSPDAPGRPGWPRAPGRGALAPPATGQL